MRRPTIGILAGIGLLVLAFVLAARGAAPVAAQPSPPSATPQSAQLSLTIAMGGFDGATGERVEFSLRGEGDIDAARHPAQLSYETALLPKVADPATPMPERVPVEMVVVDGRLYMRDSARGRWTWLALPADSDVFQLASDASHWTKDWGGNMPSFVRVGPATLNAAATTHWRAAYDVGDPLLADPFPAATPVATPAPTMTATVDLWIGDAAAYVQRMATEMRFARFAVDGQGGSFALTMTLDYSAFDRPVAIVAPAGPIPAIDGAPGEPAGSLFPSLSALALDGSTFALPGGGNMIAGAFLGDAAPGDDASAARSGSLAGQPLPHLRRGGVIVLCGGSGALFVAARTKK